MCRWRCSRKKVKALDDDYRIFYRRITEDLIADPAQSVDAVMERHIRNELGAVPEEQLCAAMSGMIWIDLFARSYFREKVVQTLADARYHSAGIWSRLGENSLQKAAERADERRKSELGGVCAGDA